MTKFKDLSLEEKRNYINTSLHEGVVTVEFTKVDGERRVMPCTLRPDLLPPPPPELTEGTTNTKKKRTPNSRLIQAYCLDKKGWRSFYIDRVVSITK